MRRFDFSTLDELISTNATAVWRQPHVDCSKEDFFGGHKRVFEKYRGLFLAKYDAYFNMSLVDIKKLVPRFPSNKCKQIVIGAGEDIVLYIAINNKFMAMKKPMPFTLFMPTVWNEKSNLLFTQCAVSHQLNNCANAPFIRILLPKDRSRLLDKTSAPRVSLLEIATIYKYLQEWNLDARILRTDASFDYDIVFI